jgi:hypothetical protein
VTGLILSEIVKALIAASSIVATTLIGIYVPRAISAFERRTGLVATAQERLAIQAAVTTAAGLLETRLDQGALKISDITPGSPAVVKETLAALARVPDAVAAQGVTRDDAAAMIVAATNTSPGVVVPPIVVPPAQVVVTPVVPAAEPAVIIP